MGLQVDLAGFLDIFFYFFDEMCCFLQQEVHDQPVCSFLVTPPFLQGVFPSHQNILQEYLHYVKVTLIHLKVLYMKPFLSFIGNTSLVFKIIRYIVDNMQVAYFIFLECGSSLNFI